MSYDLFTKLDEPYAAGFFEYPEKSRFYRFANAHKRYWQSLPLPGYNGGGLYPNGYCNPGVYAVNPSYSFTVWIDENKLQQKDPVALKLMKEAAGDILFIPYPHCVGGNGYTHSFPNYPRIVKEGLNSYRQRVLKLQESHYRDGLLCVLEGIKIYHERCLDVLVNSGANERLISAFSRVPFEPARDLYEAIVCWNFIYYVDGCDNPGSFDRPLYSYWKGEDMTSLISEFYDNVNINSGWSATIGPKCNELTKQCIRAIAGKRRPSMEFRVDAQTPDWAWQEAAEALKTGAGNPAFYNEELYQAKLHEKFPYIPKEDLMLFNGGGCTETMLAGVSNVGSLDAGINAAVIFSNSMRAHLAASSSFEAFYNSLMEDIKAETLTVLRGISQLQKARQQTRPNPLRSLLIDDCIDTGKDFNGGGARYYWSVVNVAGLINIIDSMLAIKQWVFDNPFYTAEDFIKKLDAQEPAFLDVMKKSPCYGVNDEKADAFAAKICSDIFMLFDLEKPFLGGAFLPSIIEFATYVDAGKEVPATPDGRAYGAPLCDCAGAVHGKDTKGPTALLNSVAAVPFNMALGTPVLNLRLNKNQLEGALKPLIMGFFKQGGMQVQISCLSREDMLDALENPQNHENLIVRIGGYSEYFNYLSNEMKQTVINRTEHTL